MGDELPENSRSRHSQKFGELFRWQIHALFWNLLIEKMQFYPTLTNVKETRDFVMILGVLKDL